MRHQELKINYVQMFFSSGIYLALAFTVWIFLRLVNACFWLPGFLRKREEKERRRRQREMEEQLQQQMLENINEERINEELENENSLNNSNPIKKIVEDSLEDKVADTESKKDM